MPMTIPSIGDAFPLFTHPFNGWMARETAESGGQVVARAVEAMDLLTARKATGKIVLTM